MVMQLWEQPVGHGAWRYLSNGQKSESSKPRLTFRESSRPSLREAYGRRSLTYSGIAGATIAQSHGQICFQQVIPTDRSSGSDEWTNHNRRTEMRAAKVTLATIAM